MELRWFEPIDARKFIELSKNMGLLVEADSGLSTGFDLSSIEVPIGFRPSKDILIDLEQDNKTIFMQLVNKICINTGLKEEEIIAEINKRQVEMHDYVSIEVIAILFAKEKNVDVEDFFKPTIDKILKSS
jgi:hypothetical protein